MLTVLDVAQISAAEDAMFSIIRQGTSLLHLLVGHKSSELIPEHIKQFRA